MDHIYYNSPYYTPVYNHYWEPQLPPNIHIHPESPAGQLGLTPKDFEPILREQQEFQRNEIAQPHPVLIRPTATGYHGTTRIETTPDAGVGTLSP